MALTDNILAYYKLDESSGNASDATGNGLTLTNTNTVPYGTGIINNGAQINNGGAARYLTRTSAVISATNDFTLSFWVNLPDTSEAGGFVRFGEPAGSDGWGCGVGGTQYDNVGNNLIVLIDGIAWRSLGSFGGSGWKFVTITRTAGGTWTGYVNASALAGAPTDTPNAPSARTYVGADQANWEGTIDEIGAWSRVLSGAEITQLYNAGAGLAYPFSTGTTVFPSTLLLLGV